MKEIALLSQFPTSKTEQKEMVDLMVESLKSGNENPLRIEAAMTNIEAVVKEYRGNKEVKEILLDEVRKYPKSIAEIYNATFQEKEVGVKYDFSECGHIRYNELVEQIAALTEQKKQLEAEIRAHKDMFIYTDLETGESYEVNPPKRTASCQVVVTIKK
jgi:hypothetical protein